jgi:uncharacterized protein (DUF58 family)
MRSWLADVGPVTGNLGTVYSNYLYYARRRAFNPTLVFVCVFAASVGLAFFDRAGRVACVAQLLFGAYLFLTTRAVARNLVIRISAPTQASEGEMIEIGYDIENPSSFPAADLMITDRFEGSLEPEEVIWLDEPIQPFRTFHGSYRRRCDAGMGVFKHGPVAALVSDSLGIFQFIVTEDEVKLTEIYPRVTPLPNLPIRGSKESFTYGNYDVASRGLSSNFIGVRDYERGDSLRHISWKLTLKARKLLVKEFEKNVNASITLMLDMADGSHMGWQAESTWEYAKDIALSIVTQEMANGNLLQLVSNHLQIPGGAGEQHNLLIIKSVFDLMPQPDHQEVDLVARAAPLIGAGTTAIYIGPVFNSRFAAIESSLVELKSRGVDVIAVLLDAGTFVMGKVHSQMRFAIESRADRGRELTDSTAARLAAAEVITYVIRNGCDIGVEMLRPLSGGPVPGAEAL